MKKSLAILLLGLFLFAGCSDELAHRLDRLEERVKKLERLCSKMNNNISALQKLVSAIEDGNFVTSVEPLEKDGKIIGYVIKFSKGDTLTIYNGEDGIDGQDGKDAQIPVLTVERYSDGAYYWKLNGQWLLDGDGNKLRAGAEDGKDGENGENGENGTPGNPGQDGIVPQFKIEEGEWFVSVDNGQTWQSAGRADGLDGQNGTDADTIFSEIDTSNPDYVIFRMTDGSEIKVPTWAAFEKLQALCTEINSNIEAANVVVSALQNEDYIVSIDPVMEEGIEIGYEIVFSESGKIRISNGKDADPVSAPSIGIAEDQDGIYYWTLNGTWMLDSEGAKMRAEGYKGESGKPGQSAQDAVVPELKIENNKWYVSYDNGGKWIELGNALGEQGPAGNPMDPIFKDVNYDESNVYFTMMDGTVVTVPFASESLVGKVTSITYLSAQADGRVPVRRTSEDKGIAVFSFLICPESVATEIAADWNMIVKMKAFYTLTKVARFIDLPVTAVTSGEGGLLTVTVSGENLDEAFYAGEKAAGAILFLNDGTSEKNTGEIQMYPEI